MECSACCTAIVYTLDWEQATAVRYPQEPETGIIMNFLARYLRIILRATTYCTLSGWISPVPDTYTYIRITAKSTERPRFRGSGAYATSGPISQRRRSCGVCKTAIIRPTESGCAGGCSASGGRAALRGGVESHSSNNHVPAGDGLRQLRHGEREETKLWLCA